MNYSSINDFFNVISDIFNFDNLLSVIPFLVLFVALTHFASSILSSSLYSSNDIKESNNDYDDFTKRCESDLDYYGITPKKEEKLSFYQKLKRKYSKEDF